MKIAVVIPARLDSTRLPGKVLMDIAGKPMLLHVYEKALEADVGDVFVATDSEKVRSVMEGFGAKVIMTGKASSGTHRVYLASKSIEADIFVNLQGDEPMISPDSIRLLSSAFANDIYPMATLAVRVCGSEPVEDKNIVKVVLDRFGRALYFSRSPLPFSGETFLKHIGIYAYRRHFLETFVKLPPSPLEKIEGLEQLRALWNGYSVRVYEVSDNPVSVDTLEDLERVRRILGGSQDPSL